MEKIKFMLLFLLSQLSFQALGGPLPTYSQILDDQVKCDAQKFASFNWNPKQGMNRLITSRVEVISPIRITEVQSKSRNANARAFNAQYKSFGIVECGKKRIEKADALTGEPTDVTLSFHTFNQKRSN